MKTQKENKNQNEYIESVDDLVDAKSTTDIAVMDNTQLSTTVAVSGRSLEYATLMPFYTVCNLPDAFKRQCHEGDVIIKRGSDNAFKLLEPGQTPLKAIVIDGQQAVLECLPMGGNIPRVWRVGTPVFGGGTPKSLAECWNLAKEAAPEAKPYRFEDYNRMTNPIPEHYLAEALYLKTLIQVPDSIPDAFDLVTIGGAIYVPANILFKKFDVIGIKRFFNNIQVREAARHASDPNWKWSPAGQFVSVGVNGRTFKRPNGTDGTIWTIGLQRLLDEDMMIYQPTDAEREDLTRLFMSLSDTEASVNDVACEEF